MNILKLMVLCAVSGLGACTIIPGQMARMAANQCADAYPNQDSSAYWQCLADKEEPYLNRSDPRNSAFILLYYRSQRDIWARYEHPQPAPAVPLSYDAAKRLSLEAREGFVQKWLRR